MEEERTLHKKDNEEDKETVLKMIKDNRSSYREFLSGIDSVVPAIIAIGVLFCIFTIFNKILFCANEIKDTNRDIVMFILGSLTSTVTAIISYYFGSSSGSKDKNEIINRITNMRKEDNNDNK